MLSELEFKEKVIKIFNYSVDVMFEDKLISEEERVFLKEKLMEIGYEKKLDEILDMIIKSFNELDKKVKK
jgi:hypothetical protein